MRRPFDATKTSPLEPIFWPLPVAFSLLTVAALLLLAARSFGQGNKPKQNSSVAKQWSSGMVVPTQVARGRPNIVTEDTAAWNTNAHQAPPQGAGLGRGRAATMPAWAKSQTAPQTQAEHPELAGKPPQGARGGGGGLYGQMFADHPSAASIGGGSAMAARLTVNYAEAGGGTGDGGGQVRLPPVLLLHQSSTPSTLFHKWFAS